MIRSLRSVHFEFFAEVLAILVAVSLGFLVLLLLAAAGVIGRSSSAPNDMVVVSTESTLSPAEVDSVLHSQSAVVATSRVASGTVAVLNAGGDGVSVNLHLDGVDPEYLDVMADQVAEGTFFTDADNAAARPIAVIGPSLVRTLLLAAQGPVGQRLQIQGIPFTVVGVLRYPSSLGDQALLKPFRAAQVRLFGARALDRLLFRVTGTSSTQSVTHGIEQVLRRRHNLHTEQAGDFAIDVADAVDSSGGGLQLTARRLFGSVLAATCKAKALCRDS